MGRLSDQTFGEFLDSLKTAGVTISNEAELRERLAEAQLWQYAFTTLASNGRSIGIRFEQNGKSVDQAVLARAFSQFDFAERDQAVFAASLKADHH